MDIKENTRHWLFALGATMVYMAASAMATFVGTFVLSMYTGQVATPEAFLAWWFGAYLLTLCAILGYIWYQERSLNPYDRRDGLFYIALPIMSLLLWCSTSGELVISALALIMMTALAEARLTRSQIWGLCSG